MSRIDKLLRASPETVALLVMYVVSIGPAYTMPWFLCRDIVYWPIWQIALKSPTLFSLLTRYICFWLGI